MNDLVLAVDTTHEHGSLALCAGERVLAERAMHAPGGFGQVLFEEIRALLAECGVGLRDCALFAGAAGPGSFTGVRIALACVKGLGEVLSKPVLGVSNLEALATFGQAERRAAVVDARKGEVYAAVYGPEPMAEAVLPWERLMEQLAPGTEIIAMDFAPWSPDAQRYRLTTAPRAQAAAMARLAWRHWSAGASGDPALVDANYVRRPEAEVLYRAPEKTIR